MKDDGAGILVSPEKGKNGFIGLIPGVMTPSELGFEESLESVTRCKSEDSSREKSEQIDNSLSSLKSDKLLVDKCLKYRCMKSVLV